MGLYNIIAPCVVDGTHHVRDAVLEFDDRLAAPYVESGALTPYRAGAWVEQLEPDTFKELAAAGSRWVSSMLEHRATEEVEAPAEDEKPKSRRRRKVDED